MEKDPLSKWSTQYNWRKDGKEHVNCHFPNPNNIREAKSKNCGECITTTKKGNKVTQTLMYQFNCNGEKGVCIFNNTQYSTCTKTNSKTFDSEVICFNPEILGKTKYVYKLTHNNQELAKVETEDKNKPVSFIFDACKAINMNNWFKGGYGGLHWERKYMLDEKYMCLPSGRCKDKIYNLVLCGMGYFFNFFSQPVERL